MARKLAISNNVIVPVTLNVNNATGGKDTFKFDILAERRTSDEMRRTISDETMQVDIFLAEVVKGWERQRLVLEDDNSPSEFSADAFKDMLSVTGAPAVIFQSYLKAITAKEKNS